MLATRKAERAFLTSRALAAVGLAVGFYMLAFVTLVVLVAVPLVAFYLTDRIHIGLVVVCFGGAIGVWMAVVPRFDEFDPPGPRLVPERQPRLFAELARLAAATGQPLPKDVYLTNEVGAWVARRHGLAGIGSRRVMGLGLPFLQAVALQEFRAVAAHEFGHYQGGDVPLVPLIYTTQQALLRTLDDFEGEGIHVLFRWYAKLFFRVTAAISRHQERRADQLACETAGGAALARALRLLPETFAAFDRYQSAVLSPVLDAGFLPPVAQGFSRFLARSDVQGLMRRAGEAAERLAPGPYDSHPPLAARLAEIAATPVIDSEPQGRALDLLDDLPALEEELFDIVFGRRYRVTLDAVAWEDVGMTVYFPRWTRLLRRYARIASGITPSSIPELDREALHAALQTGDKPAAELALELVTAGVAVALTRRGFRPDVSPEGLSFVREGEWVHPLTLLEHLEEPGGGERWRAFCDRTGISNLDFAVLANGPRPSSLPPTGTPLDKG